METAGLTECFKESEKDKELRYVKYLDDGDSMSISEISALDPYPEKSAQRAECIGDLQKRLHGRLRKLKATKNDNFQMVKQEKKVASTTK